MDYVIGADKGGTLALAKYHPEHTYWTVPFIEQDDLESGHIIVCSAEPTNRAMGTWAYRLRYDETTFEITYDATQRCGIEGHDSYGRQSCGRWDPNGHLDRIKKEVQSRLDSQAQTDARNKAAAESPLIVLAGLQ